MFGEHIRIGRRLEDQLAHQPGRLMIAVPITRLAVKARDDHIRAIHPHRAHYVTQHSISAPMLQRLIHPLREAEIGDAGEHLIDAVVAAGRQQFFRAHNAQRVIQLRPDRISPALAAIERQ